MHSFQLRIAFSCSRIIIFFFVINTLTINGFGKEFDKRVSEKIFINEHPKEAINSADHSLRTEVKITSNKRNITYPDKFQQNDSSHPRTESTQNFRPKRNVPLADEDLFEFMVRIANTPIEWERIRRVLSRIKEEENENTTFTNLSKTFRELKKDESEELKNKLWSQTADNYSTKSTTIAQDRERLTNKTTKNLVEDVSLKKWPPSDWIRKLIKNTTKHDYFFDDDEDDFEYSEHYEVDDVILSTEKSVNKKLFNASEVIETNSKLIVPNSALPNFVYRRVTPNSENKENSAYIAVSVISSSINETQNTAQTEHLTNVHERHVYENEDKYRHLERLDTKRRHSRRKYHKT